jgi:aldose 1-epimerase
MRHGAILAALILTAALPARPEDATDMNIKKTPFGKTSTGEAVDLYTLTNARGMTVKIMTLGATVTELWAPDRKGKAADVALGFDDVKGFQSKDNPYFGCIVGRYANRIANGKFTLGGTEYKLAKNDNGKHHLHGGNRGFDKQVWRFVKQASHAGDKKGGGLAEVVFAHVSPDKDEGYPGELKAEVSYTLTDDNKLIIRYEAKSDRDTVCNLTNHLYFNLAGHDSGSCLDHEVTLFAKKYTPVDADAIPTGALQDVAGTPFDFLKPHAIGRRIEKTGGGYDHNYVIDGWAKAGGKPIQAARVLEPGSGRVMDVLTTEPGVQFYTGNFLAGVKGKSGATYKKHAGFCLEAQKFPDSPNQKAFPSAVLKKGDTYRQTTIYQFSTAP